MSSVGIMASSVADSIAPVGYATIATTSTEVGVPMGTGNAIPGPAGVTVGDLLVAYISHDSSITVTAAAGWTQVIQQVVGTAHRLAVFARIATGSDALTVTGSGTFGYCAAVLRVTGHAVTTISTDIKSASATGTSSLTPDPPSLNTGTSRKWLWLPAAAVDVSSAGTVADTMPAGYTLVHNLRSVAVGSVGSALIIGQRKLETTTEDPAAFASTPANSWVSVTVAVPPAP